MAKSFGAIAGGAIRSAAGRVESRQKLIGAVRAACTRQAIGDDDRRAIQREVTGKDSLADMNPAEIGLVLDRLNKDWKGPSGHRAYVGKLKALWWTAYWLGAVESPSDAALAAFVKRQTGKARIQFLGHKEAFKAIEALKAMAAREGVRWPADVDLLERKKTDPAATMAQLERHAVLAAIGAKLRELGALHGSPISYCEKAFHLPCNHWSWTARQLDGCIRELGKRLRRELGKRETAE